MGQVLQRFWPQLDDMSFTVDLPDLHLHLNELALYTCSYAAVLGWSS